MMKLLTDVSGRKFLVNPAQVVSAVYEPEKKWFFLNCSDGTMIRVHEDKISLDFFGKTEYDMNITLELKK